MFLKRLIIISSAVLLILHQARCQSDASPEPIPSSLVDPQDTEYASPPGHGKPMVNSEEMLSTDYDNFPKDGPSPSRDIDSIESSNNVNVNVNSNSHPKLPWNQPQSHRNNRRPNSQYRRNRRKKMNGIMPSVRLSPNSNYDYNFAHPGGNVRLHRKKSSIRKPPNIGQNVPRSEEFEISIPSSSGTLCYPIILQVVKYMKRMETNMRELEAKLRPHVLGSQEDNSNEDTQ